MAWRDAVNPARMPPEALVDTHEHLALFLGGSDTSFTGDLLRLIAKADPGNRARLRDAYPVHAAAWEAWAARAPLTVAGLTAIVETAQAMASSGVPDPLPLRNIPVPLEVTAVEGCNCGGLQHHRAADFSYPGCSLWALPHEQAVAAIEAAEARLRAYTDSLNARLRAALKGT